MSKFVFDIEADNLLDKASVIHSLVLINEETDELISCADHSGYRPLEEGFEILKKAETVIGHNILGYDLPLIKKLRGSTLDCEQLDTLLLSRMRYPEISIQDYSGHYHIPKDLIGHYSLEAFGYRLGINKKEYTGGFASWSELMQRYCEQDVRVALKLYRTIAKSIGNKLSTKSIYIETEFQKVITIQEQAGVPFDKEKAITLQEPLLERKDTIVKELQSIVPPKEIKLKSKTKYEPFNPGSRDQIAQFFMNKYNWAPTKLTPAGKPKLGEEELLELPFQEAKLMQEYFQINKLIGMISGGDNSWLRYVVNNKIHGRVITVGAVTGRCTHCIEEDQRVMTYNGYKKIKDIEIGDYVYCYDNENNIRIRKVLDKINSGIKKVYSMEWVTNNKGKKGSLVCTQDHKIFLANGEERRLADIKNGDKLRFAARSIESGRYTINSSKGKRRRQSIIIKEEIFKTRDRSLHVHHIDHDKLNDSLSNLKLMEASDHMKLHSENKFKLVSKYKLLRMLVKSKGRPALVPMDFNTFKSHCNLNGINLNKLITRYRQQDNTYITKAEILKAISSHKSTYAIGKELRIHWTKSRLDKLLDSHDIVVNHWVRGVKEVGMRQTYDLTVDEFSNFICEEISVSNSSPNLAQIPSSSSFMGKEVRALFYAPKGYKMVGVDAKSLELRCFAHYLYNYDQGVYAGTVVHGDIHTYNQLAANLDTRDQAKTFIYALLYGAGSDKIGSIVVPSATEEIRKSRGYRLKSDFMNKVPAMHKLLQDLLFDYENKGYIVGIDGRHLMVRQKHSILNTLLQNAGAVVVKLATVIFHKEMERLGIKVTPVLHIHDEFQTICKEQDAEMVGKYGAMAIKIAGQELGFRCELDGEYKIGNNWAETH